MSEPLKRIVYVDGRPFEVDAPVWGYVKFLTDRNAAMADHVVKLAQENAALKAKAGGRAA